MKCEYRVLAMASLLLLGNGAGAGQYIFPAQGQSPEQQKQDEFDCHQWDRL